MRHCAACGGAIGEQGKAYGYAGRWCHCTKPIPNDYPHITGTQVGSITEFLGTPARRLEDLVRGPTPAAETLTPTEFVFWLKGYVAAQGQGFDPKIVDQLAKVKT